MTFDISEFITTALDEDIGGGDFSTLACVPENATGRAQLYIKQDGILAGVELARQIFHHFDPGLKLTAHMHDGDVICNGDIAFEVSGSSRSILTTERLVLNFMQRMSGIATLTNTFVKAIKGTRATILDTRKTTPTLRYFEKWAVKIGGGENHRFGLYDMIMLKDNHIDFSGGIDKAITKTVAYLKENNLSLPIEIETRNLDEVRKVLQVGGIDRIMLDNFTPALLTQAIQMIDNKYETEASGNITLDNIRQYAETGVDFISTGAITHSAGSLDMSLKAIF